MSRIVKHYEVENGRFTRSLSLIDNSSEKGKYYVVSVVESYPMAENTWSYPCYRLCKANRIYAEKLSFVKRLEVKQGMILKIEW